MLRVLMISDENEQVKKLSSELSKRGLACSIASTEEETLEKISEQALDLVLVATDGLPASSKRKELAQSIKQERHLPVITLVCREALDSFDSAATIDDFVTEPWDAAEVALRTKRILWRTRNMDSKELVKCGDLVIDLSRYEVSVNGRLAALTFKEYELLRFLASNKGMVFTREALLNRVWGYDYYGGDRTVDVHVRRLRSKIDDSTHSFIETVRNIGYKFKGS
jgi:DNA-binding response OmpR family regulator